MRTKIVYLHHFDSPLGSEKHQAQHYLGSCVDLKARDTLHHTGKGAKILAACVAQGIGFKVVRVWAGGRRLERKLKNRHNHAKLCPVCNAKLHQVAGDIDFYEELDNLRAKKVKPLFVPWYEEEGAIGEFESLHPAR